MTDSRHEKWLDDILPKHLRLTNSVVAIIENLLKRKKIEYLTVYGRTKTKQSAIEKISRKGYRDPQRQLTDLSGIRIIVFFESAVEAASAVINSTFRVDQGNSLNQADLLSTDQIGYRSVHFVCDIGKERARLPEFSELSGLKFEFQVRTVLQHAWAELAHDRKYKFSGKLPPRVERQLFLYAGMLEIADRGFNDVSKEIDDYVKSIEKKSASGDFDIEIDSITLPNFFADWCKKNKLKTNDNASQPLGELIDELRDFGIHKLADLQKIIPANYSKVYKSKGQSSTIFGILRDWMLIHDWRRFLRDVKFNWSMDIDDQEGDIFDQFFDETELDELYTAFDYRVNREA